MRRRRTQSEKPETSSRKGQPRPIRTKRLDAEFVRNLIGKQMWWDDDPKATGFGVRSYPGGTKSFFIDYRLDGVQRRFTIGPFPRWPVAAAREKAKELRKQIDAGVDPAGNKRERRTAPTVQDLIDRYIADHLPKKTVAEDRIEDEKKMLAEIGDKLGPHTKVADVHGGDIRAMHRRITESGRPVRANRILAIASKAFSLSLVPLEGETLPWRNAVQGNPCKGIEKNHEEPRERYYSKAEIERIADALATYPGVAADCMRLVMLTGCRPGEAMQATWEEFDKEPGFWIKKSAHVKIRREHKLPLSPPALELIDKLRKKRKGKFVFPGDIHGEHLKTLNHVWEHVLQCAQLQNDEQGRRARPYDLRHTFASVAVGGGLNLPIIGKLLGHTQSRTTQRYAHIADDPLREAANKVGTAIAGTKSAEVVPLHGKRQ
jgi:integrase